MNTKPLILTVHSINYVVYERVRSSRQLHKCLVEPVCQLPDESVTNLKVEFPVEIPWCVVLVWFTPFIQVSRLLSVVWQHWLADPMLLSKLYSGFVK